MKTLYVFADFDWLASPTLVGVMGYDFLRGSDSYSFEFDTNWLRDFGQLFLSADLNNYTGKQYTLPGRDIFGCFSDTLPDRWGRLLLNRREQILASEEGRNVRRLSSFDYLTGIDDFSRMGGFRFKDTPEGDFISSYDKLKIPPLTDIRTLAWASMEFEKSEEEKILPETKWFQQLIYPGSSLGGARPKAGVRDEHGNLYLAKFPSKNDDYDVALWEHLSHLLGRMAGVEVADTNVMEVGNRYHALLSRRFDRNDKGRRIHFASAMTLLGLTDGSDAKNGKGYLDIVDFILQTCTDTEHNLQQLFRRVAFNIAIGNTDDHFRNHGFLLTPKGWILSPAYDLNPTLNRFQSLMITSATNEADLRALFKASEEYMIGANTAAQIIKEVLEAVAQWRSVAHQLNIPKREIDVFAQVFDRHNHFKPLR